MAPGDEQEEGMNDNNDNSSKNNNDNNSNNEARMSSSRSSSRSNRSQEELEAKLKTLLGNVERLSTTESIGRRNVVHHRTQSSRLSLSILDMALESPNNNNNSSSSQQQLQEHQQSPPRESAMSSLRRRVRSQSVAEHLPSLLKFQPGSHLLEDFVAESGCLYLSLWLLPPAPLRHQLAKEIAKLALRFNQLQSSAPFIPHVTIVGSIKCDTQREAQDLGERLRKGLKGTGKVPCRFDPTQSCRPMWDAQHNLVWSQSCIAFMERSDEFMNLIYKSREVLQMSPLPPGEEWTFPGPACEPHYSKYYGKQQLPSAIAPPQDFVATEAALYLTTPGTVEGVSQWREITRIPLC